MPILPTWERATPMPKARGPRPGPLRSYEHVACRRMPEEAPIAVLTLPAIRLDPWVCRRVLEAVRRTSERKNGVLDSLSTFV